MQLIDGKAVAAAIKEEIAAEVKSIMASGGKQPHLAAVLVGHDGGSETYVKNKVLACEQCGFKSTLIRFEDDITEEELLNCVKQLNEDSDVDGFIVQLPLPKHINEQRIIEAIDYRKDVDGFHPINVGKLVIGEAKLIPCTPLGILEMIKSTGEEISGKLALVIGRSNIVGKPISTLLLQNNATVITAHSRTKDLETLIEQADIIVSCVGVAHFLSGKEKVKPTCTIIDVGNNYKDGKLVGDVNLEEFMEKVAYISPVPGGVGPLTITMLMRNTLTATYDLLEK